MTKLANRTAPVVEKPVKKVEELQIPNREQLCEKITAELTAGRKLEDLTAANIIGISAGRIKEAEAAKVVFTAPKVDDYYKRSRACLQQPISEGTHVTLAGAGGRDFVRQDLSPFFEQHRMYTVLEITPCPGDKRILEYLPDGLLLIQFPEVFSDNEITYSGEAFKLANTDIINKFVKSASWTVIEAPWDESKQPVAAVKTTESGRSMVIFVNLFATPTGRWIRPTGKTVNTDNRKAALNMIIEKAIPLLTNIIRTPQYSPMDETILEAVSTFTAVKTLGIASLGRVDQELTEAKDNVERCRTAIDTAQTNLIDAIRAETDNDQKIELLSAGRDGRIMAALSTAMGALDRIQGLRPITACKFEDRNNQPALYVETKDLVIDSNGKGTDNRFVKGLKFWIMLDHAGSKFIEFDNRNIETRTVHPHVMYDNRVCWGKASSPISQAAGRNDWVSVVTLTMLWASQYSHTDHSTHRDFPETKLKAGWVEPGTAK